MFRFTVFHRPAHEIRRAAAAFTTAVLAASVTLVVSACGGGGDPVAPKTVSVSITPTSATVNAGATQVFTATVTNSTNTAVTWSATGGTVSVSGASATWTAPAAGGTYTVTATSAADPTRKANATVTVPQPTSTVTPAAQTVYRGETVTLTAAFSGSDANALTWTTTCGTLTGTGQKVTYTAPDTVGACAITARSTADNARTAVASVSVRPAWRVAAMDDNDDGACTWSHCSLREAITAANANANVDTINVVNSAASTITLSSALPVISKPVHIVGPGVALLTLNANGSAASPRRGLTFVGDLAGSLSGMTVRGGVTLEGGGGINIEDRARVALTDVRVVDNETRGGAGGGVRVVTNSQATLLRVVVDSNRASATQQPGGGMEVTNAAVVTMSGGSVSNNTVSDGWAGGIRVLSASLTLDSVVVRGNRVLDGNGQGGGIQGEGATSSITLRGTTVRENRVLASGGGLSLGSGIRAEITNSTITGNTGSLGGGIVIGNAPDARMTGTTVSDNVATTRGGGLFVWGNSTIDIDNGIIRGNRADSTGGGGMYVQDQAIARLTETVVDSNEAMGPPSEVQGGGGLWAGPGTHIEVTGGSFTRNVTWTGWGAAVYSIASTIDLTDVMAHDNRAGGAGGAYAIVGASDVTISGGAVKDNKSVIGAGGGVIFASNSTGTLSDVEVSGNVADIRGGGIQLIQTSNVTLDNVTITGNEVRLDGGGIGSFDASVLTMNGGVVDSNRVLEGTGGGLGRTSSGELIIAGTRFTDNTAQAQGGGLQITGSGTSTLRNVTVNGNTAVTSGGGGMTFGGASALVENSTISGNSSKGVGGGIFSASTAIGTFRNVTLSGNSALVGGGIGATGVATMLNATIVANTATGFGGGSGSQNAGKLKATNVLLSGNLVADAPQNCGTGNGGAITSSGGNLSDDAACTMFTDGSDMTRTAAGVSTTLANNGGPTFTLALLEGSAAINAAVASACSATDQRGFTRKDACDIGAFEFGGTAPASGSRMGPTRAAASARRGSLPPKSVGRALAGGRVPPPVVVPSRGDERGAGGSVASPIIR